MEKNSSVRIAELSDNRLIQDFLSKAKFVHRHLDWRNPWDWINHDIFLIHQNKRNKLDALLSCTCEIGNMFWVRLFAFKNYVNYFTIWNQLFNYGIKKLRTQHKAIKIYSLAYYDWMIKLLEIEGWKEIERIIQFEWDVKNKDRISKVGDYSCIRRMKVNDLEIIHEIDTEGFKPLWQQSLDSISASFQQSGYATVFVGDTQIQGFQISTIVDNHAHLARIAVHPDYQRKHIGQLLVSDLLNYCIKNGIYDISVNTQVSNVNSTALYEKLGFKDTGNSFPIFEY